MPTRRVLQVALAAVAIMAVAFVARPSEPQIPEQFSVERHTPSRAPSAAPEASEPEAAEASERGTAEPGGQVGEEPVREDGAGPQPGTRDVSVVLHTLDPRTLEPLTAPLEVSLGQEGPLESAVSPDGRIFALYHEPFSDVPSGALRLYDTERLDEPLEVVEGVAAMATGLHFSPDSRHLMWFDLGTRATVRLAALRLASDEGTVARLDGVELPPDMVVTDFTPLDGGRVAVQGHTVLDESAASGGRRRAPETGPLRLLVGDLATGEVAFDVTLLEPDGGRDPPGPGDLWFRQPAVAWDHARDRAYVAEAERDAVLVVDLATGEVTGELAPAEAPAGEGPGEGDQARWREATLGAGGTRLYVGGTAVPAPEAGAEDPAGQRERELPVLVADLEAGTLESTGARGRVLAASEGGEHVLVAAQTPRDEPPVLRLHGGARLEPRWEQAVGQPIEAAFVPDGLLQVFSVEDGEAGMEPRGRLDLVRVEDGSVVRTVRFEGQWWHPHLPAPALLEVRPLGSER